MKAIYSLSSPVDIPEYEGFAWAEPRSSFRGQEDAIDDFYPQWNEDSNKLEPVILKPLWKPKRVVGNVHPWNDYPCIQLSLPAFSRRAVDALYDLLEPCGELLPLISDVGEYFVYNVTVMADVLDTTKSQITWGLDYAYASSIQRYEFSEDRLIDLFVFRIPQTINEYYVTELFARRVQEHKLHGIQLTKLWPLPEGDSWWENHKAQSKKWQKQAAIVRRQRKGAPPTEPPIDTWKDIDLD